MKNIIYLSILFFLISCSKSEDISDQELSGTWVLSSVSGNCFGLPISESANEAGCINLPALEINCSILEFQGGGQLLYVKNGKVNNGSYSIDGDNVEVCTGACLPYTLSNNGLTVQTGTVAECNPTYSFNKSSEPLEDIVAANAQKSISTVKVNGQLREEYEYRSDGSIQQATYYQEDGSLDQIRTYEFQASRIILIQQHIRLQFTRRYEYYDEAPNRYRRDRFDESGNLLDYRLYFYTGDECGIDRTEQYVDDQLTSLFNHSYSGDDCNLKVDLYKDGQLDAVYEYQKDGKKYWRQAVNFGIFRNDNQSNNASYTYTSDGEVRESISYVSAFTYNEADYPIIENRTYLNGTTEVRTYEYVE
ncbi:MAG: hypothetical protein HKN68_15800 [Saprospiraceae bacterium]|nr:hypothetical protein [Saprospiraceae bacterium]